MLEYVQPSATHIVWFVVFFLSVFTTNVDGDALSHRALCCMCIMLTLPFTLRSLSGHYGIWIPGRVGEKNMIIVTSAVAEHTVVTHLPRLRVNIQFLYAERVDRARHEHWAGKRVYGWAYRIHALCPHTHNHTKSPTTTAAANS